MKYKANIYDYDILTDTKVVKEGWLTKRSRNRKDPKKEANYRDRYVRMTTECLSYYITNKAVRLTCLILYRIN